MIKSKIVFVGATYTGPINAFLKKKLWKQLIKVIIIKSD